MDTKRALEILKPLADGFNPITGEVFSTNSPFQQPDTVRALYMAIDALETKAHNEEKRSHQPENAGKPWTAEEDKRLCDSFAAGQSIKDLSKAFNRTSWAIQSRLGKLGKINATPFSAQ